MLGQLELWDADSMALPSTQLKGASSFRADSTVRLFKLDVDMNAKVINKLSIINYQLSLVLF